MRYTPPWSHAIELADLNIQSFPKPPFVSKRAILALLEAKVVLLKILVGSGSTQDAIYHDAIEQSLLRGGLIRSQHPAFTQLIDHRWTTFGLVTMNEYIQYSFPLSQLRCLHPSQLVKLSLRLCDTISHIHSNASFHGDISLENIIVNDQDGIYIVDYDLADLVPNILRTSYNIHQKYWATIEARQIADIRALERVIISLLISSTRNTCNLPDETIDDVTRLLRKLKQLTDESSAPFQLQRLQAILREF